MPQKLAIGALCILSVLLLAAFFVVYLTGNETQHVELTAGQPQGTGSGPEGTVSELAEPGAAIDSVAIEANPKVQLRVYVAGEVKHPGVYPMLAGDRLVDAVEAAGGPTEGAALEMVNLAARIEDEGYYYIPRVAVTPDAAPAVEGTPVSPVEPRTPALPAIALTGMAGKSVEDSSDESAESSQHINLNTATQPELETLPGIGPARARAIIAYREQNGPYNTVEEITAVSGIGQGILDNLRGLVTVEMAP